MDSGSVGAWVHVNSGTVGWSVAAIGDYNGDGTDDILWQNNSSGFVGLYEMHDGAATWDLPDCSAFAGMPRGPTSDNCAPGVVRACVTGCPIWCRPIRFQ